MTTKSRRRVLELIHEICEQYETNLKNNVEVEIGEWIALVGDGNRAELFFELLRLEAHYLSDRRSNNIGDWFREFPEFSNEIVKVFSTNQRLGEDESFTASNSYLEQIESGDRIGRFEVISLLGAGGFAVVYLAHDPELNQAVALKVLNADEGTDRQQCIECLINEANVLSQIDHPMVPKVHDVGEDAYGNPWVAMEFIKGTSLYELLTTEQLSDVETLRILVKTARAMSEIHQAGFTHRDIKPDNIIIGIDGEPRICDYGLALHEDIRRDRSGERAGTTCYMSPEQVMGRNENLDGRTDIWSLGVILYLVVAKRLPFHGNSKQEVREAILNQPVKPPRQIKNNVATIQLENICLKALQKAPQQRHPTADDFADSLQDAIDALPVEYLMEEASVSRRLNGIEHRSMRMAKHARSWNLAPTVENLPGPYRYLEFLVRTDRNTWTKSESQMMATSLKYYLRVTAMFAVIATMFVFARQHVLTKQGDQRVRDVIAEISRCPIGEVESTFQRLSAFAPEKCQAGVELTLEGMSDQDNSGKKLRLAMLSQNRAAYLGLFRESLLNAKFEDIPALTKLVVGHSSDGSELTLDDDSRRKLTNVIATTPLVRGLERIWPETPSELVESFESFGGELKAEYAWCATMPMQTFEQLCEELKEYRFRPVCVRPWVDREDQLAYVSAIWHRSSADWKISIGITPKQFLAANSSGTMSLVDVSDGLEPVNGEPQLVAIWSNYQDPYGKARQILLSERIPSLAVSLEDEELDSFGIISHDRDSRYLRDTPMLVDLSIDGDVEFEPLPLREHQKVRVGKMIVRSCSQDLEIVKGSPTHHRLEAGKELVARGLFALGDFEQSSHQYQSLDFEGNWQDLLLRTRSLAMSGNSSDAAFSKSILMKEMKAAIMEKTRPFIMVNEARAISSSLTAELEFFVDRDAEEFITWVEGRQGQLERNRHNPRYSLATEFYSMACAAHSVNNAVSAMPNAEAREQSAKLKRLIRSLAQKSINETPSIRWNVITWQGMHTMPGSPFNAPEFQQGGPVHSSAWTSHAANFESRFVEPGTMRHHRAAGRALGEGFFPVSLVHGESVGGHARLGSIWHRELESDQQALREQQIANAICFALIHNEDIGVRKVLSNSNDCRLRKTVVATLPQFGINLDDLLDRLARSDSDSEQFSFHVTGEFSQSTGLVSVGPQK